MEHWKCNAVTVQFKMFKHTECLNTFKMYLWTKLKTVDVEKEYKNIF